MSTEYSAFRIGQIAITVSDIAAALPFYTGRRDSVQAGYIL
jgi:hypothetical protein